MELMDSVVQRMYNKESFMASIMFVCLGNICRSPAAEGIMRHLVEKQNPPEDIYIRSCGIGNWHLGQFPDERMQSVAKVRGVNLSSRAQQFNLSFLDEFDYILAADHEVLNTLYQYAKDPKHKAKIHLITEFSPTYHGQEVPDPYYQGNGAFDLVLDMLEDSCEGLLSHIKKNQ